MANRYGTWSFVKSNMVPSPSVTNKKQHLLKLNQQKNKIQKKKHNKKYYSNTATSSSTSAQIYNTTIYNWVLNTPVTPQILDENDLEPIV